MARRPVGRWPEGPRASQEWDNIMGTLFQRGAFTMALTGVSGGGNTSGTCFYTVSGGIATLMIPGLDGTSNSTSSTLTGLPEHLWPLRNVRFIASITDNGTDAAGLIEVTTAGVINLYRSIDISLAFTASGAKAVEQTAVTYTLDAHNVT